MTGQAISLDLQPRIEAALAGLREGTAEHCLSDFAFSNLYLFRDAHGYRFIDGEWPGVSGFTYDGTRHFMPLFEVARAPVSVLLALIARHDCLYPVSQAAVDALPSDIFRSTASRDDADYLYAALSFTDYAGRALAKKRNLVRQFLAGCEPSARPFDTTLADAAREVLQGWMTQKARPEGDADQSACLEAIANAARFGLHGSVFFEGPRPIGFVLAQTLQPGVSVIRFAKGLDSHAGLYPFMFQHFARSAHGVRWLNFEQDMGIAGFRRSKMSFAPHLLLNKLRVVSHYAQDPPSATA